MLIGNQRPNEIEVVSCVYVSTKNQSAVQQLDGLAGLCKKQGWIAKEIITWKVSGGAINKVRKVKKRWSYRGVKFRFLKVL